MKTILFALVLAAIVFESPLVEAQEFNEDEKEIMGLLMMGEGMGAVIDRDGVCAGTVGGAWTGPGTFLIAFPMPGADGSCRNTFNRVNPDGSEDRHVNGVGGIFVFVIQLNGAFVFKGFPSAGSNAHWTAVQHTDGIRTLTINGTLSDGSQFRAHSTQEPQGNSQDAFFWIQGLGYLVGQRGK